MCENMSKLVVWFFKWKCLKPASLSTILPTENVVEVVEWLALEISFCHRTFVNLFNYLSSFIFRNYYHSCKFVSDVGMDTPFMLRIKFSWRFVHSYVSLLQQINVHDNSTSNSTKQEAKDFQQINSGSTATQFLNQVFEENVGSDCFIEHIWRALRYACWRDRLRLYVD